MPFLHILLPFNQDIIHSAAKMLTLNCDKGREIACFSIKACITSPRQERDLFIFCASSVAPSRGGEGGGGRPPNVFQSIVLDSFKSDELRRGVGKLSADSVAYLACIYS